MIVTFSDDFLHLCYFIYSVLWLVYLRSHSCPKLQNPVHTQPYLTNLCTKYSVHTKYYYHQRAKLTVCI